ncbi:hypothetical protein L4D09_21970 [Photobacterium makurazakiensis]|uniref:hypothetical protein n=1 Tax=Photobacterium makurazakiensis TaxID=2910234 RepID=UPI003D12B64F
MDPNWLNALVALGSLLTLLTSVLIGYLFRLSKELSDYKTYVAQHHATKEELKDMAERMERHFDTGFDRIVEMLKQGKAA